MIIIIRKNFLEFLGVVRECLILKWVSHDRFGNAPFAIEMDFNVHYSLSTYNTSHSSRSIVNEFDGKLL